MVPSTVRSAMHEHPFKMAWIVLTMVGFLAAAVLRLV